ncbi:hypothetical protein NEOLEDRAFT_1118190, partial [Neolentinus lepideus HHB14362 ss-1]
RRKAQVLLSHPFLSSDSSSICFLLLAILISSINNIHERSDCPLGTSEYHRLKRWAVACRLGYHCPIAQPLYEICSLHSDRPQEPVSNLPLYSRVSLASQFRTEGGEGALVGGIATGPEAFRSNLCSPIEPRPTVSYSAIPSHHHR